MYNQSLSRENIAKCLKNSDFFGRYDKDVRRQELIDAALASLRVRPLMPTVFKTDVKSKTIYRFDDVGAEIVQRKIAHTLKSISNITFTDRAKTVRRIKLILENDMPYRVYRLDIKSFYESIDYNKFLEDLERNPIFSRETVDLCKDLLSFENRNVGIPRGFSISSIIAEMVLKSFDTNLKNRSEVAFYARYVDDIFIITKMAENQNVFLEEIKKLLPRGLVLNEKKEVICDFAKVSATTNSIQKINYLGYEFEVVSKTKRRDIRVDISPKKVRKIKSRILRSFYDFHEMFMESTDDVSREKAFRLLKDRIKFLTGNYALVDYDSGRKRTSGIYFNYQLIDKETSKSLKHLDGFLQQAVLGKCDKIFSRYFIAVSLTRWAARISELKRLSFYLGFSKITFFHFNRKRLDQIQKCWKYVE
jgi:hypothetical protein